ncbi:ATP-dependent helicase [Bosea sp. ASV33]|uniref:UvrD-helicase domain-containing protein n=1 Tax=Bosea sp. ASV33 TaxID=2795106 RepID=UPI0018EDEC63|nr:ATP-dependent helicase [Bosea sp. ASV33]
MIEADKWRPIGVPAMEPAAEAAIRARGSALVVAGPGTGKTELLGQRAAFLLQTGGCLHPRRILAISFKRDAASNLRDRVERRCGRLLAGALDSMTFDAFAKQLLDRFSAALPSHLALGGSYGIAGFASRASLNELQRFVVNGLDEPGHPAHWAKTIIGKKPVAAKIHSVGLDDFTRSVQALCLHPLSIESHAAFLQLVQLRATLTSGNPLLGFPMIGRMAQAIINANPRIRAAIRATYGHVFLDEFQDTTSTQYGLIESIFAGGSASLTAVGDDKQRIMGWAGARKDVFDAFQADFLADRGASGRMSLTRNYRSNERIVAILNTLKANLAPDEPDFIVARPAPDMSPDRICSILVADDADKEAQAVADRVAQAIAAGTDPRSIGLLVRQKAVDWEQRVRPKFEAMGLALRNEDRDVGGASIQDLMAEPYSRIVADMLELLMHRHGGARWTIAMDHIAALENLSFEETDAIANELAERLDRFHRDHRLAANAAPSPDNVRGALANVESFLGLERLRGVAPQYGTADFFRRVRDATRDFLVECSAAGSWAGTIRTFRGEGQTPLMTITKSKGLEYDQVFLLGLNDTEWWSFDKDPGEGHSVFFVAASRARESLVMTRCGSDRNTKISEIFALLDKAGVREVRAG